MSNASPTPLARALGRIPQGLFVLTTGDPGAPLGLVASLVQQMGLAPPTVAVAVGKNRDHLAAIRAAGGFTLSLLDQESSALMGAFFKKREEGASPYDELETRPAPSGLPVLTKALAWFDCKLTGEHELDDHVVIFATCTEGELQREGDPSIHLRKDGLSY